jgi:GT2 family glycosyltransferase
MMPDISVVLVNWNGTHILHDCLTALYRDTSTGMEVILVDNGSTDSSVAMIEKEFRSVDLIRNAENLGFSRACNQGIAKSSGKYVLLLNTDAMVCSHAIDQLVAFADSHPRAGIVGPRLRNGDGSLQLSCRHFPFFINSIFVAVVNSGILPDFIAKRLPFERQLHNRYRDVDWIIGACLLIKRQVIDRIGLLDENFFFYGEDMDWCYRAKQAGWSVMFCSNAEVVHLGGWSAKRKWGEGKISLAKYDVTLKFFHKFNLRGEEFLYRFSRAARIIAERIYILIMAVFIRDRSARAAMAERKMLLHLALRRCCRFRSDDGQSDKVQ